MEETIIIFSEDKDDRSLRRNRGLPTSPVSYRFHWYGEGEAINVDRGKGAIHPSQKTVAQEPSMLNELTKLGLSSSIMSNNMP